MRPRRSSCAGKTSAAAGGRPRKHGQGTLSGLSVRCIPTAATTLPASASSSRPEEVAVCRLRQSAAGGNQIEYKPVPCRNSCAGILTLNLAIWALVMMSVNEGHRPIRGPGTLPLNVWWRDILPNGEVSFERHPSGRKVQTVPERGGRPGETRYGSGVRERCPCPDTPSPGPALTGLLRRRGPARRGATVPILLSFNLGAVSYIRLVSYRMVEVSR